MEQNKDIETIRKVTADLIAQGPIACRQFLIKAGIIQVGSIDVAKYYEEEQENKPTDKEAILKKHYEKAKADKPDGLWADWETCKDDGTITLVSNAMDEYAASPNKYHVENFKNMTERCNQYSEQVASLIQERDELMQGIKNAIDVKDEYKKECEYWKQRCEAAEVLVNSMDDFFRNHTSLYKDYGKWQQLKNQIK